MLTALWNIIFEANQATDESERKKDGAQPLSNCTHWTVACRYSSDSQARGMIDCIPHPSPGIFWTQGW